MFEKLALATPLRIRVAARKKRLGVHETPFGGTREGVPRQLDPGVPDMTFLPEVSRWRQASVEQFGEIRRADNQLLFHFAWLAASLPRSH